MPTKTIEDANECLGLPLLCWADYRARSKMCFVNPWLTIDSNDELCRISMNAFPREGSIALHWTSSHRADSLRDKYGELVVVTVNGEEMPLDQKYDGSRGSNKYRGKLDFSHQGSDSAIQFSRFSNHPLSQELIQIIRLAERVSFDDPIEEPLTLDEITEIYTNLVMVEVDDYVYGPFRCSARENNTVILTASPDFDDRIASIRKGRLPFSNVQDLRGNVVASFHSKSSIRQNWPPQMSAYLHDWLTDKDLTDIANKVLSSSKSDLGLTKAQLRTLRAAFSRPSDELGQITFDDKRQRRLDELFSTFEFWHTSPDAVDHLVETLTSEQLAEIVLDDANFPRFKGKIVKEQSVQDRLEDEQAQLRQEYEAESARLHGVLEETWEQVVAAQSELESTQEEVRKAQAQVDAERKLRESREIILKEGNEDLANLQRTIEERRAEAEGLQVLVSSLNQQVGEARNSLERVFQSITEESLSAQFIQGEMVRKVVSSLNSTEAARQTDGRPFADVTIDQSSEAASDEDVIETLRKRIADDTGRSYTKNQVINFLICISQGFITTFAGKPGTGKTSLCNIIGGSLGLKSGLHDPRFVELAVEKGWDTYKDYIGYYNPLTRRHEKSVPQMYDALRMLESEKGSDGLHAPLLVLLDEANLSPIEHYWAPFLQVCDTFGRGAKLALGGSDSWEIPSWIRFVATVNFDYTTEDLSPRFLDRSWVITLDSDDTDFDSSLQEPDYTALAPISYERLMRIFGAKRDFEIDETMSDLFDGVVRCFKKTRYPVSARSQAMVMRYLSVACDLMETGSIDNEYSPLDYAICQKVFPMMSVIPSDQLRDLVDDLTSLFKDIKIECAQRKLEEIRKAGEDDGFYQYFI